MGVALGLGLLHESFAPVVPVVIDKQRLGTLGGAL
jgi:hypothetical protein